MPDDDAIEAAEPALAVRHERDGTSEHESSRNRLRAARLAEEAGRWLARGPLREPHRGVADRCGGRRWNARAGRALRPRVVVDPGAARVHTANVPYGGGRR
jgi:hypothetical protein